MIVIEIAGGRLRATQVRGSGSSATVAASWNDAIPGDWTSANEEMIASWLKGGLKESGVGKGEGIIILGRGMATLKSVRVPVVPEGELPTVVGYALENTVSGDEQVVDFQMGPIVPVSATESELDVLTATIPVEKLEVLKKVFTKVGVVPKRVTLRPYGTRRALAGKGKSEGTEGILLLTDDGAEISVWSGEKLRLCRWISSKGGISADRLGNDVRRTLAAFHAESGEDHVGRLTLVGDPSGEISDPLAEILSLPISVASVASGGGEMIPSVGGAELGISSPIDFLKPKKSAVASNMTRVRLLAGTLLAVVVAGIGYVIFNRESTRRDDQIASLQAEWAMVKQQIAELKPTTDRYQVIEDWIESGDPLLDELQEVAAQLPDTSDLFLTGLEYNAGQNNQPGTIKLDGLSRDQSIVTRAQTMIAGRQEGRYDIVPRGLDPGADVGPFVWRFGLDLGFDPLSIADYAARAEDRAKTLDALKPPPNMIRKEMTLERKLAVSSGSTKAERKEAKQAAKEEAGKGASGSELRRRKVEELKKLTPEEREAAIAKEPKFLQKQLRQELKKEGQ
jgi:Tfp pilus assembly PilM family ATPase